ncbi:MAG: beta-lactamase family protein [Burkholderiaceae bacterium]|nr:beta-lactamase family protein [Burkholderiaceae bacterium]
MSRPDFSAAQAVLRAEVDADRLAGVSAATMRHGELIDEFCTGLANRERGESLRPDHIHRAFSNTKLFTTVLVLRLADEGHFGLDDPLKAWLPAFGSLRVLRPGATSLDDTVPLARDITIRHLITHQAGFSHGVFDPGTLLYDAYHARGIRSHLTMLADEMAALATLPLNFQPGEGWEYALGIDVLARLCEIVTGQRFGDALQRRLFEPLGLVDTGFVLRSDQVPRLAALYRGDLADPMQPGLVRLDDTPWPNAYREPVARQSGAGGLFTTQADMLALLRQLMPGRPSILKPATLASMFVDQVPAAHCVQFPMTGPVPSLGYGLGGAFTRRASALQPAAAVGELQWGGLAGTHWWISPATGLAGVVMAQRHFGFWHPFWFRYKRQVYEAGA